MPEVSKPTRLSLPNRSRPVPRITSHALLSGQRQLLIEHDGAIYSLKLTRRGKLILTK